MNTLQFWWGCFTQACDTFNTPLGYLGVASILYGPWKKFRRSRNQPAAAGNHNWSDVPAIKWAMFWLPLGAFILITLGAAASRYQVAEEAKTGAEDISKGLKREVATNELALKMKTATIESLLTQNAQLSRDVAAFEFARDRTAMAVKKRAMDLSDQMFAFLDAGSSNEPKRTASSELWSKGSSGDFSKAFMEDAERSRAHWTQIESEFTRRFIGRLATVRDQLAELGAKTPQLDYLVKTPVRVRSEIRDAAVEIKKVVEQIQEFPGPPGESENKNVGQ